MGVQPESSRKLVTFGFLWLAQVVSLLGSHLTGFAIGLTVLEESASVTQFSSIFFAAIVPEMVLSPLAGTLIDRWNRRLALLVSHGGAGLCTLGLIYAYIHDALQFPLLLTLVTLSSASNSFQFPAMSSATTLLVPKENLAQASGLIQIGFGLAQLAAPVIAGFLLESIALEGVLLVDVSSFCFAIVILLIIRFPAARTSAAGTAAKGSLTDEMRFGWKFIKQRSALLGLLILIGSLNLLGGMIWTLMAPLVATFGGASDLGIAISAGGGGMLLGGAIMLYWGGPKRLSLGILGSIAFQGIILMATTPLMSLWPLVLCMVGAGMTFPVILGCNDALWQRKVPPDIQGKVFSFRPLFAGIPLAISILISGPLADYVFEPMMREGSPAAVVLGPFFGTGEGRGIAILLFMLGALCVLLALGGLMNKSIRQADILLKDYQPLFGHMAIDLGFMNEDELWKSLKWQRVLRRNLGQPLLLGEVMVLKNFVTAEQNRAIIVQLMAPSDADLSLPVERAQNESLFQVEPLEVDLVPIEPVQSDDAFHSLTLLGDVLIALQLCTQEQLLVAMDHQEAEASSGTWRPLGRILVEEKCLSVEDLRRALQVLDALRRQDV